MRVGRSDMAEVRSEMVASVWKLMVDVGDAVEPETPVVILESMKMEIPVLAGEHGVVTALHVGQGDSVDEGGLIATLE
jgi:biotin carboxyl carrier protein